jgi:hypothetical protein
VRLYGSAVRVGFDAFHQAWAPVGQAMGPTGASAQAWYAAGALAGAGACSYSVHS